MELRFQADQPHQTEAVDAVVRLLEGQPFVRNELVAPKGASFTVIANSLDLSPEDLFTNLLAVQAANGLVIDDALQTIVATDVDTYAGASTVTFPNFSVEMETGTGKTYAYIRTGLELNRRFGLRKFIIVVHSVAVREGVLKTFKITRKHFADLYKNIPYRYSVYDSSNLGLVRSFALSDALEFLVMTIDAFNKSVNVIRQTTDKLSGERPIHLIQATRPVLIIDEPQNMGSEKSVAALASLAPLMALRYSATHKQPYNLIYRLTPYDAYRRGLVKRIEIASVVTDADLPDAFVRLEELRSRKRTLEAVVTAKCLAANGTLREERIVLRPGDALVDKTRRTEYEGFEVDEISLAGEFVSFTNGVELRLGGATGDQRDAIFEAQIRYTIQEHFRKQARLRKLGIKVLSLFFVDRVASYASRDGLIRTLFDRLFDELKATDPAWTSKKAESVRAAYFATKSRRGGITEEVDSNGISKEDEAAYDLIMKDKERLLSFDEDVSFIFSHSALREGWDNPNVFQICVLREVGTEIARRQQVGRGVRLPVNQAGERVQDPTATILTVVAGESYERFVAKLQDETAGEWGQPGAAPKPDNARRRETLRLRRDRLAETDFLELWRRISQKTRYSVFIDTERLVAAAAARLAGLQVRPPRIAVSKVEVVATNDDKYAALIQSGSRTLGSLQGRYPLPNLIELMERLMDRTSPPMRLSRRTLLKIVSQAPDPEAVAANPQAFATQAVRVIKETLADELVGGIRYERVGDTYDMASFADEVLAWGDTVVWSRRPDGLDGACLYDGVVCESETIERPFAEGLEERQFVRLYIKLPHWFTVPTPIGEYNPDWAIAMTRGDAEDPDVLYLVRETKGTIELDQLSKTARQKLVCARRHFETALGGDYRVVTAVEDLPDGGLAPGAP